MFSVEVSRVRDCEFSELKRTACVESKDLIFRCGYYAWLFILSFFFPSPLSSFPQKEWFVRRFGNGEDGQVTLGLVRILNLLIDVCFHLRLLSIRSSVIGTVWENCPKATCFFYHSVTCALCECVVVFCVRKTGDVILACIKWFLRFGALIYRFSVSEQIIQWLFF